MAHINVHLGLLPNTLAPLHDLYQSSADQARFLKMPPQPEGDRRTSLLAYTDIGSITIVWNVLGGLPRRALQLRRGLGVYQARARLCRYQYRRRHTPVYR